MRPSAEGQTESQGEVFIHRREDGSWALSRGCLSQPALMQCNKHGDSQWQEWGMEGRVK